MERWFASCCGTEARPPESHAFYLVQGLSSALQSTGMYAGVICNASIAIWAEAAHKRTAQKAVFGWARQAHWNALHLRLIYFGREHCPAPRHDPSACRICAWAAVPPYDRRAL